MNIVITINDAPVSELAEFLARKYKDATASAISMRNDLPRIGEYWTGQGGIYAGIMRGRDGAMDYPLIVGPELDPAYWDKVMAAAAALEVDSHKDFRLPFRPEQSLQFANVPELFKPEVYWSCEKYADDPGCAWLQGFGFGGQAVWRKGSLNRARAVRIILG